MYRKLAVLGLAGMLAAQPASAAVQIYTFSVSDSSAGLGAGPYGTVTVTEGTGANAGSLLFDIVLNAGFKIHDGNQNHNAFTFRLNGDPSVTISNLTSGFAAIKTGSGDTVSSPPFGNYLTGIDCTTACGPGWNGGFTGPLSFKVSAGSALSLASLGFNTVGGNHIYFTSDMIIANGKTGNVGAVQTAVTAVPEPATWAMMLVGFGALGFAVRRRPATEMRIRFA